MKLQDAASRFQDRNTSVYERLQPSCKFEMEALPRGSCHCEVVRCSKQVSRETLLYINSHCQTANPKWEHFLVAAATSSCKTLQAGFKIETLQYIDGTCQSASSHGSPFLVAAATGQFACSVAGQILVRMRQFKIPTPYQESP